MAIPASENIVIRKGSTYARTIRWDTGVPTFKGITGITRTAPPIITCVSHNIPEGWPVTIVSVQGMDEINNVNNADDRSYYTTASVVDVDNVKLPFLNTSEFTTYSGGGYIKYYTPKDLSDFSARLQIRQTALDDTEVVSLVSPTDITLDNTNKTITFTISATVTAAFGIYQGVYDLEVENTQGVVYKLLTGDIEIIDEVTR